MSANKIKSLNHLKNKPSFVANLWLVAMCSFPWDGPLNGFLTKFFMASLRFDLHLIELT